MAAAPPIIVQGPPPFFVEHIFFKSYPELVLPNPIEGSLERSSYCLDSSSKFGVLLIAGQSQLTVIRADDVLTAQIKAGNEHQKHVELAQIPRFTVENRALASAPCVVAISNGEEFIAVDTLSNGVPFVLIFKLEEFLLTAGKCEPFVTLRASSNAGSKVVGIAWNPGENMTNMLAINCDDGMLQLVTVKGAKAVEMGSYKGSVKSMCWSPKGKQLVVGTADGSLCQLRLDLTEAKKIPGPGSGRTSSALFWTATTQFLVNMVVGGKDIDFMQLDLSKGAAPAYTSFGDVFISDRINSMSKCSFVPILPWNIIVCTSNTINDLLVLGKGFHQNSENWIVTELNDNRRAAIPIDSFAVGAALYNGFESQVVFNEAEAYRPMPVLFVLSESGILSSFSVVNSRPDAPSMFHKVPNSMPAQMFITGGGIIETGKPPLQAQQGIGFGSGDAPQVQPQASLFSPLEVKSGTATQFTLPSSKPGFGLANLTPQGFGFTPPPPITDNKVNLTFGNIAPTTVSPVPAISTFPKFAPTTTTQSSSEPSEAQVAPPTPLSALLDLKSLPTSGIPSLQQAEDLQRLIEEKRAQGGFRTDDENVEDADIDELLLEAEKFRTRLEIFYKRKDEAFEQTAKTFSDVRKQYEEEVLAPLNIMEDFVATLKETTEVQKEEINGLKERIFGRFTQLEYAKALADRNEDPQYKQLQMAQPMDAGRAKKFQETEKLYLYIKNQLLECQRFFKTQYLQKQPPSSATTLQAIYQTLSNHSKVIRKLTHDINMVRIQLGLHKTTLIDENVAIFDVPTMGHNYYEKKSLLKEHPKIIIQKSPVPKIRAEKSERLTLDDLTAGISRMKFNRLKELGKDRFGFPESKPMKISAKKLESLTKEVANTVEIEIPEVDKKFLNLSDLSEKYKTKSRTLIDKLDDKSFPRLSNLSNADSPDIKLSLEDKFLKTESIFEAPATTVSTGSKFETPATTPSTESKSGAPAKTASTGSILGEPATSASPRSILGEPATSASPRSILGDPATSASPRSILGEPATSASPRSILGEPATSASPRSILGAPATTASPRSIFGAPATTASPRSIFGAPTTTASPLSIFGAPATTASPPSIATTTFPPSIFGTPATTASIGSIFGAPSTTASPPSIFGAPATTVSTGSLFKAPATTPSIGSIFGAPSTTASTGSIFGVSSTTASTGSIFGTPTTTVSTGGTLVTSGSIFEAPATTVAPVTTISTISTFVASIVATASTGSILAPVATTPSTKPILTTPAATTPASASIFGTNVATTASSALKFGIPVETTATSVSKLATPVATTAASTSILVTPVVTTEASNASKFGTPVATAVTSSSIFTTSAATTTASGSIFGIPASTTVSSGSIFGTPAPTSSSGSLFGDLAIGASTGSIFGAPAATASTGSIFGAPAATASTGSIFGAAATTISTGSIFGAPATTVSTGSIFGAPATTASVGSIFGAPAATTASTGLFGSPPVSAVATSEGSTSVFGGSPISKPAFGNASVFGGIPAFGSSAAFGGNPAFGSGVSTFGSAFGSTSPSAGTGSGSIFGGGGVVQQNASSFGQLAQAVPAQQQAFGSFGSPQAGSIFGGTQAQPAASIFGAPAPTTSNSLSTTSVFGGSSISKPAFGNAPVFGGTPAFGNTAAFGGSPAFGSGVSTFGSAFGSTSPSAGTGSGIIFGGGGVVQQNAPSFGQLAQAVPAQQQAFGSFGSPQAGSVFGAAQAQPTSPFGQSQQQQNSPFGGATSSTPSFGGSAFSSWR